MKALLSLLAFATISIAAAAQNQRAQSGRAAQQGSPETEKSKGFIKNDVRAWLMTDSYTLADTIAVDTLLTGHQTYNPVWRNHVSAVTLGNLGSPSQSTFFPTLRRGEGFVFFNTLLDQMEEPEDYVYYNTRTPYVNLTYQTSFPKRRAEEYVHVLFTQNVNSRFNVGFKFRMSTAIGRFESQRTDHSNFRLFGSFDGVRYNNHFNITYHNTQIDENGGLANDQNFIVLAEDGSDNPEDFVVNFTHDANNYLSRYKLFYNHSLNLATTTRLASDSTEVEIPIASAHHTLHMETSHREFTIDNLSKYNGILDDFFKNSRWRTDSTYTRDNNEYRHISNLFQLKMSEEFNTALRFGLRLFVGNDIRVYRWPTEPKRTIDTLYYTYKYERQLQKETQITSHIGGQIFKNIGKNLRWQASAKLFFQGYNAGDFIADGSINTMFPLLGRTAEVYARGHIKLRSLELLEEKYHSNHFSWNIIDPSREKTLYAAAGIKWGDITELMGYTATINSRFYLDENIQARQNDGVLQLMGLYLFQHFRGLGFNSINRVAVQFTSNDDVVALPSIALQSSNFYQNTLFKVLTIQLGADVRYNSKYFAPAYQPALLQFYAQNERKVGGYCFIDPFLNFHIKRVRFYVKYEHVNDGWFSRDYFHTIHYPSNTGHTRIGISWNFYD